MPHPYIGDSDNNRIKSITFLTATIYIGRYPTHKGASFETLLNPS